MGRPMAVQIGCPANLSGSDTCMDAGKEREQGRGSFVPTKKAAHSYVQDVQYAGFARLHGRRTTPRMEEVENVWNTFSK